MASTFRRRHLSSISTGDTATSQQTGAKSTPLQLSGTKAWTAGCALVSTGLREFDALLLASQGGSGGGQPLGSCIYIESDQWSILSDDFVRYWCAEALSHDQVLIIPFEEAAASEGNKSVRQSSWSESDISAILDTPNNRTSSLLSERSIQEHILARLPRNLHIDRGNDSTGLSGPNVLDTLEEEDEQETKDDGDDGLVVAWQYRKDIQEERLGLVTKLSIPRSNANRSTAAVFCCSYDLQGRLADQINVRNSTILLPMRNVSSRSNQQERRRCGFAYYRQLVRAVQSQLHVKQAVIRVLLYQADVSVLVAALPLFLSYIRQHKLPVVVLVTSHRPTLGSHSGTARFHAQLERCVDVAVSCESFAARRQYPPPAEFHKLHGLLAVKRAATCTLASSTGHFADLTVEKRPAASLYGLRRDARKLHLSLLHISPEDFAADGSSVGTTAVRSGGGRPAPSSGGTGCSASGGGGNSPLDF